MTRHSSYPGRGPMRIGALLLALAAAGCGEDLAETAPPELIGHWTTTDARYADRGFDISRDSIVFHTGGESFTTHAIEGVATEESEGRTLYRVLYRMAPDEEPLAFSFHMDAGGEVRFRNQQGMVWTRQ